jgi:hypothetical protein
MVTDFRRNIARGATVIRLLSSIRNHSCDGAVKAVAPTRQNTCTTDILTSYPYFTWLGPHKTSDYYIFLKIMSSENKGGSKLAPIIG